MEEFQRKMAIQDIESQTKEGDTSQVEVNTVCLCSFDKIKLKNAVIFITDTNKYIAI